MKRQPIRTLPSSLPRSGQTLCLLIRLYRDKGLSDAQIKKLVVLDLKAQAWFDERNICDQHGGGGYFAHDEAIMGWLFGEHGIGDTQNDT